MPKRVDSPNKRLRVRRSAVSAGYEVLMGEAALGELVYDDGWRYKPFSATAAPSGVKYKTPLKALQRYFRAPSARSLASEVLRLRREATAWEQSRERLAPEEVVESEVKRVWNLLNDLSEGDPLVLNGRLVIRLFGETFVVEGVGHTMNAFQAARYLARLEKGSIV